MYPVSKDIAAIFLTPDLKELMMETGSKAKTFLFKMDPLS